MYTITAMYQTPYREDISLVFAKINVNSFRTALNRLFAGDVKEIVINCPLDFDTECLMLIHLCSIYINKEGK